MNPDLDDKVPLPQLRLALEDARQKIPVSSRWRHYKGEEYLVLNHTVDKNTNDLRILYARPSDMDIPFDCLINEWQEPLETDKFAGTRFTRV